MMVTGRRLKVGRSKGERVRNGKFSALKGRHSIAQGNALCECKKAFEPCRGDIHADVFFDVAPTELENFYRSFRRAAGRIRPLPYATERAIPNGMAEDFASHWTNELRPFRAGIVAATSPSLSKRIKKHH